MSQVVFGFFFSYFQEKNGFSPVFLIKSALARSGGFISCVLLLLLLPSAIFRLFRVLALWLALNCLRRGIPVKSVVERRRRFYSQSVEKSIFHSGAVGETVENEQAEPVERTPLARQRRDCERAKARFFEHFLNKIVVCFPHLW